MSETDFDTSMTATPQAAKKPAKPRRRKVIDPAGEWQRLQEIEQHERRQWQAVMEQIGGAS